MRSDQLVKARIAARVKRNTAEGNAAQRSEDERRPGLGIGPRSYREPRENSRAFRVVPPDACRVRCHLPLTFFRLPRWTSIVASGHQSRTTSNDPNAEIILLIVP
jgi:hypothetical protein